MIEKPTVKTHDRRGFRARFLMTFNTLGSRHARAMLADRWDPFRGGWKWRPFATFIFGRSFAPVRKNLWPIGDSKFSAAGFENTLVLLNKRNG